MKMRKSAALILCLLMSVQVFLCVPFTALAQSADSMFLSDMDWESATTPGYMNVEKDKTCDGAPAVINGVTYQKAIGTHTINDPELNQDIVYDISDLGYVYFSVLVGIKDQASNNKVNFSILVDNVVKAECTAYGSQEARDMGVQIIGAQTLTLRVNCADDGFYSDNAIWAMPVLYKGYPNEVFLSNLDWESADAPGYGAVTKDKTCDGFTALIGAVTYAKAIGTHAVGDALVNQEIVYDIENKGFKLFSVLAGVQNQGQPNMIDFAVLVDGVVKANHHAVGGAEAKKLTVSLVGAAQLTLRVNCSTDGMGYDSAVWAMPLLRKSFPDECYLSEMNWDSMTAPGWGSIAKDTACGGAPAVINGVTYPKAIGTHAINDPAVNQDIVYDIAGMGCGYFETLVGILDQSTVNNVHFSILVDGAVKADYIATGSQPAKKLFVSLVGASTLTLRVNCTADGFYSDNAIWAMPLLKKSSPASVYLSDTNWQSAATPGYGDIMRDKSATGTTPIINGVTYEKAIGTHAINDPEVNQDIVYNIGGLGFNTFKVWVGILGTGTENAVKFSVLVDNAVKKEITVQGSSAASEIAVFVRGAQTLTLRVNCTSDYYYDDNALWAMPELLKDMGDCLYLSDIDWESAVTPGWGSVQKDKTCGGEPAVIMGETYPKALGTHAIDDPEINQDIVYDISGMGFEYFSVFAGIYSQGEPNKVAFSILLDNTVKTSYLATGMEAAERLVIPVSGAQTLTLRVNCSNDGHGFDNAIWGMPKLSKGTENPYLFGDIDGDFKAGVTDLVNIKRHFAGIYLTGEAEKMADIDHSGDIGVNDILLLKKCLLGMENLKDWQNASGLDAKMLYKLTYGTGTNVLSTDGFAMNQGTAVIAEAYTAELNRIWQFEPSGRAYRLKSAATGRYLEASGTGAVVNDLNSSIAQKWYAEVQADGKLSITSASDGKSLAVNGSSILLQTSADGWTAESTGLTASQTPALLPLSGKTVHSSTPEIVKYGDTYYSYIMAPGISIKSSKDMLNWTPAGTAFDPANLPSWIEQAIPGSGIWAPGVYKIGNKYFLYYCISTPNSQVSAIGVAANETLDITSPNFNWVDQGEVIGSNTSSDYNCIDPNIFIDDNGQPWLIFGSHWGGIYMRKIDSVTGKLDSSDATTYHLASRAAAEASNLIKENGYYYLFAAVGVFTDSTYRIVVGRSENITGPYLDADGKSLFTDNSGTDVTINKPGIKGPGHGAIFKDTDGKYYVVSEYFEERSDSPSFMLISDLVWDAAGWPVTALTPNAVSRLQ